MEKSKFKLFFETRCPGHKFWYVKERIFITEENLEKKERWVIAGEGLSRIYKEADQAHDYLDYLREAETHDNPK